MNDRRFLFDGAGNRCSSGARAATLILALAGAGCGTDRDQIIHASGHIEATEVRLSTKVGGRLIDLPFQEGDEVSQGAIVARLETTDAEIELAGARAALDAADAKLRLLLAGTRAEDVRQASEELARTQAELDAAARDLARLEGLADRGTATEKARDDARTRRAVAGSAVNAIRANLDKLIAGPRREEIEVARALRAGVEATIAAIEQRISDATIVAPREGVITSRTAEPGEVLAPGALVSVLTDLSRPWLNAYVDEPSLTHIRVGDPVTVKVDGRMEPFTGTVGFVSREAEFTPRNVQTPEERAKLVFKVKVHLDNASGVFKPGLPADAYFRRDTRSAAASSPSQDPPPSQGGSRSEGP